MSRPCTSGSRSFSPRSPKLLSRLHPEMQKPTATSAAVPSRERGGTEPSIEHEYSSDGRPRRRRRQGGSTARRRGRNLPAWILFPAALSWVIWVLRGSLLWAAPAPAPNAAPPSTPGPEQVAPDAPAAA